MNLYAAVNGNRCHKFGLFSINLASYCKKNWEWNGEKISQMRHLQKWFDFV